MPTLNQKDTREQAFNKEGVKTRTRNQRPINYIGTFSSVTFKEQVGVMRSRITPAGDEVASIGEFYTNGTYQKTPGSQARSYEKVYGDQDWTKPIEDDPRVQDELDELFGDNDKDKNAETSAVAITELKAVLGKDRLVPVTRSLKERRRGMTDSQNSTELERDEDTRGIIGREDETTVIEPIV